MEGWLGLRDRSESSPSFSFVPPGLLPAPSNHPALKRWAKLFRPSGTGSIVGDLTQDLRPGLT